MTYRRVFLASLVAVVALSALVAAQDSKASAITGTVVDGTSRAPMARVNVEAVSDVNGDRPHVTVTDGDGAYQLTDLPSGTYTVTFTVPEYVTLKREGLSLPSGFTARLPVLLKRGTPTRD